MTKDTTGSTGSTGSTLWSGAEIRERFLRFFEERGHTRMDSSSLIPRDPTVLLTTAGMQQMIPYFLGQETPPAKRLTTAQKCFRTTDIDEVGDDSHLTFFEMLGNFSVGDYFKREAIEFAWELLTRVYGIPAERLYPTVHQDDAESPGYWQAVTGIPAEAITRLDDNWWGPPGDRGPCGPDSEIYYDRGLEYGCGEADCAPACPRCDRFLEIWNLVFMQYYQDEHGARTLLKQPNIDTGMGLERLAVALQGVTSIYDTDIFRTIIDAIAQMVGTDYGKDAAHDRSLRVLADHGRGLVFMAADGVLPSNTGRGYVFRRVLRRMALFGKRLGLDRPFLTEVAEIIIGQMGDHYTQLQARHDQIIDVLSMEERKFNQTLATGLAVLERDLERLSARGETTLPGNVAFRLYDTHGFPLELTEEVVAERGMTIDRVGFESAMEEQRERARSANPFQREKGEEAWTHLAKVLPQTVFTGYDGVSDESEIVALLVNGQPVDMVTAPENAAIVLARTPFYAEAGGQRGDQGVISNEMGAFQALDTQRPIPGLNVQFGQMTEGSLRVGASVRAQVNAERRRNIMRNHSATHLLHRALKDLFGEQVNQRGSLVAEDRLRFDFSLNRPLTDEELREVDRRVSAWVLDDLPVTTQILPYKEAIATGAMALFSEKYGDLVRVVTMGPSRELCGGTHVGATGQIGLYLTTQEVSVAANTRRIEALTGVTADTFLRGRSDLLMTVSERLRTKPDDVLTRVDQFQEELADARRELAAAQRAQARELADQLAGKAVRVGATGDTPVVAAVVSVSDDQALRALSDTVRAKLGPAVVALIMTSGDQARFVVMVDPALTARGVDARAIAADLGARLGGKGGGRPELAQGGGKNADAARSAAEAVPQLVGAQLK
ncbi:MAG TPA: alanine--tRNA ligase [Ktedonobacterales bacterium]|jgi:alanyl-tRNA synthetase|nr:alanine--tRNA ligase [Ktedonobacterales bacterium]